MTVISYVCENGDITEEIVVNDPPFDERLDVFSVYMIPLARYIENIHNVVIPLYPVKENEVSMAAIK
jgi:type I restriction enzyme R subunit